MRKMTEAQRQTLKSLAAGNFYFRSPFNSTDYALERRGFVKLTYERRRSAGPAYHTETFYRELTDAGRRALEQSEGK